MKETNTANLPIMGTDSQDNMLNMLQKFDSSFRHSDLYRLLDFPYASEQELILHYTRGAAGPPVDIKIYADVGVGWTLNPVGFTDESVGTDAKEKAEDFMKEIDFNPTMKIFARWLEVIGRSCIIETYNKLGGYYQNKNAGITGSDCINPTTLTPESIKKVMNDITGTALYEQKATLDSPLSAPKFTQDRVIYRTLNGFGKKSVLGSSKLQRCVTDLRTMGRFPHYRRDLGRLYSQMSRVIKINTEKFMEMDLGKAVMADETGKKQQEYVDDTAEFYRQQEEKGGTFVIYDWEELEQAGWGGKEVKLAELEMQSLENIGYCMGVPLALVMSVAAVKMNRATMEMVTDLFVSMQEKGTRNDIYTPIIEHVANKFIESEGITGGRLECQYNPFLPKDMVKIAGILSALWPTGALSRPDVREYSGFSNAPNMGGDDWEGLDPMPNMDGVPTTPTQLKEMFLKKGGLRRL